MFLCYFYEISYSFCCMPDATKSMQLSPFLQLSLEEWKFGFSREEVYGYYRNDQ